MSCNYNHIYTFFFYQTQALKSILGWFIQEEGIMIIIVVYITTIGG